MNLQNVMISTSFNQYAKNTLENPLFLASALLDPLHRGEKLTPEQVNELKLLILFFAIKCNIKLVIIYYYWKFYIRLM